MTLHHSSPPPDKVVVAFDRNAQFDERYVVGVDLGQSHDPTAVCIVRRLDNAPRPVFRWAIWKDCHSERHTRRS